MNDQTAKADSGKLPMDLVPPQIIRDIAEVRKYGNDKYGDPDNWRRVEKRRYVAALMRHLAAYVDYLNGDDDGKDKESGIEHHKHMACNMAFICEMEKWEEGGAKKESLSRSDLIHCGECKHYVFIDDRVDRFPIRGCSLTGFNDVDADDFCSRAEKREVTE